MKKLIIILATFFCLSCEKEEITFCWDCGTWDLETNKRISATNKCGLTEEKVEQIERDLSSYRYEFRCEKKQ